MTGHPAQTSTLPAHKKALLGMEGSGGIHLTKGQPAQSTTNLTTRCLQWKWHVGSIRGQGVLGGQGVYLTKGQPAQNRTKCVHEMSTGEGTGVC